MRTESFALVVLLSALFMTTFAGCTSSRALPPQAIALNSAGAVALAAGDLETAEARLSVALEYEPRFVEALTNLALVELERGNFARSRQLCERAIRINPDVAQPHHALGVLAEREGRRDYASDHYREALAVDPGFTPSRANLGRLYFEAGRFEHARQELKKLTELAPADAHGWSAYVETLIQLGRIDEADTTLQQVRSQLPTDRRLDLLESRRLLRRSELPAAKRLLDQLEGTADELTPSVRAWRAVMYLASGCPVEALREARLAIALDDQEPVATRVLAQAAEILGQPDQKRWSARARDLLERGR